MKTKRKRQRIAYRIFCPEVMAKIKRLKQLTTRRINLSGKITENTQWYGYYNENGILFSSCIGKRLPASLQKLLDERVWDSDREVYHWPKSHHLKTAAKGGG